MKFLWIVIFLPFSSFAYTLISDLDDTIKITNSAHPIPAASNGVFSRKIFSGMKSYLTGTQALRTSFYVVTASPKMIQRRVEDLFEHHELKVDQIFLKPSLARNKLEFKVKTIRSLLEKSQGDVVLVGDDVGEDPEVYQEIKKEFSERVKAIYIRPIRNRPFVGTQINTTLDLAFFEFLEARLPVETVLAVAQDHLSDKMKLVIPKFAWCPLELSQNIARISTYIPSAIEVAHRINTHCKTQEPE